MTIEEIKAFIDENAESEEVKSFITSLVRVPGIEDILKMPDVQKEFDRKVSASIQTFKEKTLPTLVDAEKKKLQESMNPSLTPEMQRIQELEKKLAEKDNNEKLGNNKNKIAKQLADAGLPAEFADYLADLDEDQSNQKATAFLDSFSKVSQKIRDEVLKGHTNTVPQDGPVKAGSTGEPGPNASKEEWANYTKAQLRKK
jgi:uncharacterized protein YdiU (UPF0061 family)